MSDIERRALLGAAGVGVVAAMAKAGAGGGRGGPLDPPAGTVAPSGRTLDEIYNRVAAGDGRIAIAGGTAAVTLNQPGSYVLTGSLTTAGSCISINASYVTIDLNGFTLNTSGSLAPVIGYSFARTAVVIRNGRLVGGYEGIGPSISGPGALSRALVENLEVLDTRARGININSVSGNNVVRRCVVIGTGATSPSDAGQILYGILVEGNHNRVEDCSVADTTSNGAGAVFRGISTGTDGTSVGNCIQRCSASQSLPSAGQGVRMLGSSFNIYRDNTVINYLTAYSGGSSGGGNV